MKPDDVARVAAIARGDECALGELYDAHAPRLLAFIVTVLGRREGAEEVLAELFQRVWLSAPEFDPNRMPVAYWLIRMARDLALAARDRTGAAPMVFASERAHSSGSDAGGVLAALAPRERQTLQLAFYGGWTIEAIAIEHGEDPADVKRTLRSAMEKLRGSSGKRREVTTA